MCRCADVQLAYAQMPVATLITAVMFLLSRCRNSAYRIPGV